MKFISRNKINKKIDSSFDKKKTFELSTRLEKNNYKKPYNGLKDLHLLGILATNKPELISENIHLLNKDRFDEN